MVNWKERAAAAATIAKFVATKIIIDLIGLSASIFNDFDFIFKVGLR